MTQQESNASPIPNPNRAIVEASNARRVARRRAAATAGAFSAQSSVRSLQRGFTPRSGGRFEEIETLPAKNLEQPRGVTQADALDFLKAFQFAPQREVLARSSRTVAGSKQFFSTRFINDIIQRSRRSRFSGGGSSRRGRQELFGGVLIPSF